MDWAGRPIQQASGQRPALPSQLHRSGLFVLVQNGFLLREVPIVLPARTDGHSKLTFAEAARRGRCLLQLAGERFRHAEQFRLPFADATFEGVYNLGVMEHFTTDEIARILSEFRRVLRPGGKAVLFWPRTSAPSVWGAARRALVPRPGGGPRRAAAPAGDLAIAWPGGGRGTPATGRLQAGELPLRPGRPVHPSRAGGRTLGSIPALNLAARGRRHARLPCPRPVGTLRAMKTSHRIAVLLCACLLATASTHAAAMKALIVDGQNNHDWKGTTPHLKKDLEATGLFEVDVATSPAGKDDMASFKPEFKKYKLVVSNYNGADWPKETQTAFEEFVRDGGGFVSVHAANNSFPNWPAYNQMIGLGGWGGRSEKSGPYVYWEEKAAKVIKDIAPGRGGSHGPQHEFFVETREPSHPIVAGLPVKWLHAKDELYDRLRGPAENLTVLATAFAPKEKSGTDRHEPMLMTTTFGKGRVFHTALGHAGGGKREAQQCVGFIVTFQRGAEWAVTGKVTQKVPADFPGTDKVSLRE